ncbi:hypothetical protein J3R30DRAFT_3406926 [Lentinula aciculospora]|uniref:Condensation domain-containing protein n=1 Tax=Lentinula aciculospora TaxID=153920 RepID=A0A9W9A357_9AGAR|nr:hypothetical protein J3R30DRAFT_3406926 [Lentinula aciculospora]
MAAYTFTTNDRKIYERKLHGFEALCNTYALHDFLLAFTGSAEVQLKEQSGTPVSQDTFSSCLRTAWIVLRHRVPAVALRTTYEPEDASWTVSYDVPAGLDDIDTWVGQTLVWRETKIDCLEHDLDEKWEFTHGEYPLRLTASPVEVSAGRYMLSLSGPHGMLDGRMSMILLNELVGLLNDQIREAAPVDLTAIKWGEETARLASTGAVLTGLDMDNIPEPAATEGEEFVPFLPPSVENKVRTHNVTMRLVVFDEAQTSALRQKCREHDTTITVAMDAIFTLAHSEAVLASASAIGGTHYSATIEAYLKAKQVFMPLSCKDQGKLTDAFKRPCWASSTSINHPNGTTLFGVDGFPLQTKMDTIRKAIGFSVDTKSFKPCDEQFIWGSIVKNMAAAHATPQKDLSGFHPSLMMVRVPIASSIGNLEMLGLFSKNTSSFAQVHRVLFRARVSGPTMTNLYWQFDDKLHCSLLASAEWNSPSEMDDMEKALRKWFDIALGMK